MDLLSGKSKCIDRSTSGEREMCVLFEFRHSFNSENLSTYFNVCVYLCKNSDRVTVLHFKRHLRRWRASQSVLVF